MPRLIGTAAHPPALRPRWAGIDRVGVLPELRATAHSGNYVVGAVEDGQLVGCSAGFLAADDTNVNSLVGQQSPVYLYSYISGVPPEAQNRGIGYALKRHQWEWALRRGLSAIRWTYDPLLRRNAYLNLCKLGACVISYEPDFFGNIDDGINTGEITDRLLAEWPLRSPRVMDAMRGIPVKAGEQRRCWSAW